MSASPNRRLLAAACGVVWVLGLGCRSDDSPSRPNLLLIVWDTVRADRLGLYGHGLLTTPHLERWAARGRVYDAMAPSCWTIPSHATLFTGLLPSEHALVTHDGLLDPKQPTLAERLGEAGYQTYAFSANPHVSARTGLTRGFERVEHPFDPALRARARALASQRDAAGDAADPGQRQRASPWSFKDAGPLANERFAAFLDGRDPDRPFFAFLNYMEAHRPREPRRALRSRMLRPGQVERSYTLDESMDRVRRMTLGLRPAYGEPENEVLRGVYDASLAELDLLLDALLQDLEARGLLDGTAIVLTSDHGEHLGEHHNYLHQFSLYEGVLRVPLVVWAPGIAPGREPVPVSGGDVFATLAELAGLPVPAGLAVRSLLRPEPERALIAEYPVANEKLLESYPEVDPAPFASPLEAVRRGRHKLVRRGEGGVALFDLEADPGELDDLAATDAVRAEALVEMLDTWHAERNPPLESGGTGADLSDEEAERLRALGYL